MDVLSTLYANTAIGLETAFSPTNLLYCFFGVFLGTFIGVLPGIGALAAVSMLVPLTFHVESTSALIMLAGIWYGSSYGGSTASILLNLPGTPQAVLATLDGYPMAKKGRAGVALFMTAIASFVGGTVGILLMMLFSPLIVYYAIEFGSAEFFTLMVLGLVAASTITTGSAPKAMAMVVLGIMIGTVGADSNSGVSRYTFGIIDLYDGVSLIALAMGLFGVSEVIASIRSVDIGSGQPRHISFRSMIPSREEVSRSWLPTLRGTAVGAFFGALPGTGPTLASSMAYALEKKASKTPEIFGTGAIEGVVAPESANNASDQTSFIPTMTLGIPGSATMALLLGVLLIHGVTPGPTLMADRPDIFWGLVMSFWIGNILLLVLNIPLIGLWVRLLLVPYKLLYPAILVLICIGVYSVNNSSFDIWVTLFFGAVGYLLRLADLPPAPLLLGFVLGPLMETHFRRAMLMSYGEFSYFIERPISATILAITAALLLWTVISALRSLWKARLPKGEAEARSPE